MSNPARCRPPAKRACSIFRQRFVTTSRPASWAIAPPRRSAGRAAPRTRPRRSRPPRSATSGSASGGRKASTMSGVPAGRRGRDRRADPGSPAARGHGPDLEVRARRAQVGQDEVARLRGIRRRADDRDRPRRAGSAGAPSRSAAPRCRAPSRRPRRSCRAPRAASSARSRSKRMSSRSSMPTESARGRGARPRPRAPPRRAGGGSSRRGG